MQFTPSSWKKIFLNRPSNRPRINPRINLRMNLNPILKARIALLLLLVSLSLSSCSLPQVKAEDRLFLDLSVDFLGEYRLPKTTFEGTPVGGLSGITYDRQRDRLYAISDDRSDRAPARFYTLKLTPIPAPSPTTETATTPSATLIPQIEIESVTPLTDPDGNPYAKGTVDPEGIALSPRQTLYISSEGVSR
ncbi:MAG: esterase-like activity of phytase family protein, partial [Oculatellaceae cyanobacterium Prado106]|nr:esterase-like activity of phytase family protein [Oculatellaceae cyanobacterium Prado106]